MPPARLTEMSLRRAVNTLRKQAPIIGAIVTEFGWPSLWLREPGFASLLLTILEQQVSLASAQAVYRKLTAACDVLSPERFLSFGDGELRGFGFSRQKSAYCRTVAHLIVAGELDLPGLTSAEDEKVRTTLMALKGIGRWTADVYLLHSLGRPDIWPVGDLALRVAVQESMRLDATPTEQELEKIGEQFRPLRSVASRVFWHAYLTRRGFAGTLE